MMHNKILYVACEPTLAVNAIAIASAFRSVHPESEQILVDPRRVLWPEYDAPSPSEEFKLSGFQGEVSGHAEFAEVLRYGFPARAYLYYQRLFQRIKPSVVVVMHEYGYAFYAVQAAALFGIATYHVQHGVYGADRFAIGAAAPVGIPRGDALLRKVRSNCGTLVGSAVRIVQKVTGRECPEALVSMRDSLRLPTTEPYPIYADRIGVWSANYQRQLVQQRPEFGTGRIDVIGFPHGDSFLGRPRRVPEEVMLELGFRGTSKLALYLYCPFHEIVGNVVRVHPEQALLEALSGLRRLDPELNVLILPHPNYHLARQIERLTALVCEYGNVAIRETPVDFLELCSVAALVVGVMSSLFCLAMLSQVPVVTQVYVLESLADYHAIEGGAAIPVFSGSTLPHQLDRALNNQEFLHRLRENQKSLATDLLGPFDGRSGLRTAEAISSLFLKKPDLARGGSHA